MSFEPHPIMIEVGDAIAKGHAGDRAGARESPERLWKIVGENGDPFFRCAIAHSLADVLDDVDEELEWDLLAMGAASSLTNDRIREGGGMSPIEVFLPSLHLNLANDYLKMNKFSQARKHVDEGRIFVTSLAADGFRQMIEYAFERIAVELDSSTSFEVPPPDLD